MAALSLPAASSNVRLMLYVSIFVELLRSRPSLAVWLAALAQALVWLLVPSLFYAGPAGDVPDVLAVEIGLLSLTTYVGLILVGLLVLFTLANRSARAALKSYDPLITALVVAIVIGPHLVWLADWGEGLRPTLLRLRRPEAVAGNFIAWARQIALLFAAHAGLIVLVALVAGWPWPRHDPAPVILRPAIDPFARQFVYFFALAPAFAGTLMAVLIGGAMPVGGIAPLVILSGLLVVVLAGDGIEFSRQHVVIAAWFGLLIIPPIMTVATLVVLPWLHVDLN